MNFKVGDLVYYESYVGDTLLDQGINRIRVIKEKNYGDEKSYTVIVNKANYVVYIENLQFSKDIIRHATEIERLLYD